MTGKIWKIAIPLIIGLYLGLLVNRVPYLTLSKEIDIIELANLTAMILLAITLPTLLNNKLDDKRCAKNLIIQELDVFCGTTESIMDALTSNDGNKLEQKDFGIILSNFKRSSSHLASIINQINGLSTNESLSTIDDIDNQLYLFRDGVTGNKGIKPNGFLVTRPFISRQQLIHDEILSTLRNLKFQVNDA